MMLRDDNMWSTFQQYFYFGIPQTQSVLASTQKKGKVIIANVLICIYKFVICKTM